MTEHQTETTTAETEPEVDQASMSETANQESLNSGESPDSDEPETFPRQYVERLRQEAAEHRVRAQDRDDLAAELWAARVAATGRLADPTDLPMPDGAEIGQDAVTAAVEELLARKPHLASRRVVGDVGQGATTGGETVDLAGMLRRNAS